MAPLLSVKGLTVRRDDGTGSAILHELDLDVEEGEVVILRGPSGCGKTTLLKCVAELEVYTAGEILLRGRKAVEYGIPTYRTLVQHIPQRPSLLPGTPLDFLRTIRSFRSRQNAGRPAAFANPNMQASGPPRTPSKKPARKDGYAAIPMSPMSSPTSPTIPTTRTGGRSSLPSPEYPGRAAVGDHGGLKDDELDEADDEAESPRLDKGKARAIHLDEEGASALLDPLDLAEEWGIDKPLWTRDWGMLSGGEAQRIALAIGIGIGGAEVVLLDEPTSALDSVSMRKVEASLMRMLPGRSDGGHRGSSGPKAFLWITHEEAQAERVGTRVVDLTKQ